MIRHFTVSLFLLASLITIAGAQTPPGVNVKLFIEKVVSESKPGVWPWVLGDLTRLSI